MALDPKPRRVPAPPCNDCPSASIAGALQAQAEALAAFTVAVAPIGRLCADVEERLDCVGRFVKKKGPWFLWSVPLVLTGINAISPNAAEILTKVLAAFTSGAP